MNTDLLSVALAEEAALITKLGALRPVIVAYGGTPRWNPTGTAIPAKVTNNAADSSQPTPTRRRSERTVEVANIARARVAEAKGIPVPTRILLQVVESHGIQVGGKKPVSTLSALLSNAEGFVANGKTGWTLASDTGSIGLDDLINLGGISQAAASDDISGTRGIEPVRG